MDDATQPRVTHATQGSTHAPKCLKCYSGIVLRCKPRRISPKHAIHATLAYTMVGYGHACECQTISNRWDKHFWWGSALICNALVWWWHGVILRPSSGVCIHTMISKGPEVCMLTYETPKDLSLMMLRWRVHDFRIYRKLFVVAYGAQTDWILKSERHSYQSTTQNITLWMSLVTFLSLLSCWPSPDFSQDIIRCIAQHLLTFDKSCLPVTGPLPHLQSSIRHWQCWTSPTITDVCVWVSPFRLTFCQKPIV